ncbi:L-amino-acid oxidase [Metarhizium rileyi]|uniref:L-amino-acid oxidase n=1 Tax=Metarhizium rileyi (strain RCEF 4871) TaxID=1649241 RepID=A0A167AM92_METRR|nr:L-amino-acid oxidase [Metarhizium rileyi RCEF 4871]
MLSLTICGLFLTAQCLAKQLPLALEVRSEVTSRLANIHVLRSEYLSGLTTFTYGSCTAKSEQDRHHIIAKTECSTSDSRLVWIIPENAPTGGCISAWNKGATLVGRSSPQNLQGVVKRGNTKRLAEPIAMTGVNGIDVLGPWFDGVRLLSHKEPGMVDVKTAKSKGIAIVGAGMSGLMTYLVLHQAGLTNITILEASNRIGGRVHTAYLSGGPSDYSYQEMGAMRIGVDYVDPDSGKKYNISDTKLVFSLVDEMNKMNHDNPKLRVDLIPWYEESRNGLQYFGGIRLPNGLPPTLQQTQDNSSLSVPFILDPATNAVSDKLTKSLPNAQFMAEMARSMYKAHREWNDGGLDGQRGDRWSEFAYISQHLKGSLNSTDILDSQQDPHGSFWEYLYDLLYESTDTWKTVDGGFSRLPESFRPLVGRKLRFNTKVERVQYKDKKVTLQWKQNYKDAGFQSSTFDYAIVAVPFTVVRQWRLPPIKVTMLNAIKNLAYDTCCKVALEYSERFWEKLDKPIYGSCSTATDIPGIAFVCYPSYNINATGPATILGTYLEGSVNHEIYRMMTMSDEEHAQYVLDAMSEIHGEHTRQLYTGRYFRKCWGLDPLTAGAWANPSVGQHELYIPEYFKIHKNLIFVGEHTSYTHGWISSALDSGVRGGVQMLLGEYDEYTLTWPIRGASSPNVLLELGLVDEAKAAAKKWLDR